MTEIEERIATALLARCSALTRDDAIVKRAVKEIAPIVSRAIEAAAAFAHGDEDDAGGDIDARDAALRALESA